MRGSGIGRKLAARHPGSAMVCLRSLLVVPSATTIGDAEPDPIALFIAFVLLETLPLAVRRYWPRAVFAITLGAALGNTLLTDSPALPVGVVVALYTVAAHCDRRTALRAALATALSFQRSSSHPKAATARPSSFRGAAARDRVGARGQPAHAACVPAGARKQGRGSARARAERAPGRRRRAGRESRASSTT